MITITHVYMAITSNIGKPYIAPMAMVTLCRVAVISRKFLYAIAEQ
jgi:hypothetical protein